MSTRITADYNANQVFADVRIVALNFRELISDGYLI